LPDLSRVVGIGEAAPHADDRDRRAAGAVARLAIRCLQPGSGPSEFRFLITLFVIQKIPNWAQGLSARPNIHYYLFPRNWPYPPWACPAICAPPTGQQVPTVSPAALALPKASADSIMDG
jgi:hypothetical protein